MQTQTPGSRPVLSQKKNNTTIWIGHLASDPKDHVAGQTFTCPAAGLVHSIRLFSAAVQQAGHLRLTLHTFDPATKTWGSPLAEAERIVEKADASTWIDFPLPPLPLEQNQVYAFRLNSADALIGIGEAASHAQLPFTFGAEWNADAVDRKGHYFQYFSLTFELDMCA